MPAAWSAARRSTANDAAGDAEGGSKQWLAEPDRPKTLSAPESPASGYALRSLTTREGRHARLLNQLVVDDEILPGHALDQDRTVIAHSKGRSLIHEKVWRLKRGAR